MSSLLEKKLDKLQMLNYFKWYLTNTILFCILFYRLKKYIMEIKKFEMFLDGGTIKITTDEGIFCFDNRIKTTTKGRLYDDMPEDDNSNLIENSDELEDKIIDSLKFFSDDFYQSSIEHFINSKQK